MFEAGGFSIGIVGISGIAADGALGIGITGLNSGTAGIVGNGALGVGSAGIVGIGALGIGTCIGWRICACAVDAKATIASHVANCAERSPPPQYGGRLHALFRRHREKVLNADHTRTKACK